MRAFFIIGGLAALGIGVILLATGHSQADVLIGVFDVVVGSLCALLWAVEP